MRKGFSLIVMLLVITVIFIVSVPLARLSTTTLRDIPTAYRMLESNTSLLNALRQIQKDVNAAKAFPESFNSWTAGSETLLVELENCTICYQMENGKILRRTLSSTAVAGNQEIATWSAPKGKIKWTVRQDSGRPYALEVKTCIEQKNAGRLEKKMENSHLFFVGAHREALN